MLTLLTLLTTSLSAPAPVAVVPWRNLSDDAGLRSLEQDIPSALDDTGLRDVILGVMAVWSMD